MIFDRPAKPKLDVDPALDQYRHECEVRSILSMRVRSPTTVGDHLASIKQKRPMTFTKIESDVLSQWKKGNRGEWGDWR